LFDPEGDGGVLEAKEAVLELAEGDEVIGRQNLALDDREIDLDLVEPTGVDRRLDENETRPGDAQARPGALAPVRGTVVDDPNIRRADR
jgi:hypothetical protein